MRLKLKSTELYISFSFFAAMLLSVINSGAGLYFSVLITSVVHECIHLLTLMIFRVRVYKLSFSLFGGNIVREAYCVTPFKEALINISAPVFNILTGAFLLLLNRFAVLAHVNLLLGVFNALPFYNFDGGRALESVLSVKIPRKRVDVVILILSFAVIILFALLNFVFFRGYGWNITLVGINIYLICSFIVNLFKSKEVEE